MQIDINNLPLGLKVRDVVTGFEGLAIGFTQYMTGCKQLLVQPPVTPEGVWVESAWIDHNRLEVIEGCKWKHENGWRFQHDKVD